MKGLEVYVDKGWNIHTSVPIRWMSSGARESRVDMVVVGRLKGHSERYPVELPSEPLRHTVIPTSLHTPTVFTIDLVVIRL